MSSDQPRLDEFGFIQWIRSRTRNTSAVRVGPRDDSAIVDLLGQDCVITTDSVIAGVHFTPDTAPDRVGRKALARAVSDIAAVAAIPVAAVACVLLPRGYAMRDARRLYEGMDALAREFDVAIVGGDIASGASELALAVTVIGRPAKTPPILRSGAHAGERIYVTGRFGGSLAGHHLDFVPRVREALCLAERLPVTALIDVSDGLAADLNHILEESGCGAVIRADRVPLATDAVAMARTSGQSAVVHALTDGEDYELVFTVAAHARADVPALMADVIEVAQIGVTVTEPGLRIEDAAGKEIVLRRRGWVHPLG